MKRFSSGLLAALLALMLLVSGAFAADGMQPVKLYIDEYKDADDKVTGGDISLVFYQDELDVDYPGKYAAAYGNEGKTVDVVPKAYSEAGAGTTHVYIVDVASRGCSGHDSEEKYNYGHRIGDFVTTIQTLMANNANGDNAAVVPTAEGGKFGTLKLTANEDKLYEQLDELVFNEGTKGSLLATLNKVCSSLSGNADVKNRVVIYVFSNGYTDACNNASALKNVKSKLKELNAAVYTFAYLPSESLAKENADYLAEYAKLSTYGIAGAHAESPYNEGKVTPNISGDGNVAITQEQLADVLAKVDKVEGSFGVVRMPVTADMDGINVITLSGEGNSTSFALNGEQQLKVKEIAKGGDLSVFEVIWNFVKNNWILCTIGAVLVILIAVLLTIVLKRGGKSESDDVSDDVSDDIEVNAGIGETIGQTIGQEIGSATQPVMDETLNVRVDRITQGDIRVNIKKLTTSDTILVGREANECQVVFDGRDAARMSRKHAKLQYQPNGMMTIENLSGNGTKVNNEKINRPTILQQNDLVTFGDVTVRITWWVNK